MASSTLTWFITGCSSGFGLEMAQAALHAGHNVIATSRNPSKSPDAVSAITSNPNGRWLTLDVTASQESIARTMTEAETLFGPINVLVNNAAYAVLGAAEEVPEEVAREEYETNYWGPLKIVRAVLPSMRERKSGTVVNISSIAGMTALPTAAFYSGSKWALEALSESLAVELQTFNIRVLLVEPGAFRTKFLASNTMQLLPTSAVYKGRAVEKTEQLFKEMDGKQASDPVKGAQRILEVVMGTGMGKGKTGYLRCMIGRDCWERATQQVNSVKENLMAMKEIARSTKFEE